MPKAYKNFKIHPKKKVRKKILALKQKKEIAKQGLINDIIPNMFVSDI